MDAYFLSRYDDCVNFLKDPRFVRNRTTATGGGRFPFPLPKSVSLMANSMINEDEPDHRRLPRFGASGVYATISGKNEGRIEQLTNTLLDKAEPQGTVDLKQAYALPIPLPLFKRWWA